MVLRADNTSSRFLVHMQDYIHVMGVDNINVNNTVYNLKIIISVLITVGTLLCILFVFCFKRREHPKNVRTGSIKAGNTTQTSPIVSRKVCILNLANFFRELIYIICSSHNIAEIPLMFGVKYQSISPQYHCNTAKVGVLSINQSINLLIYFDRDQNHLRYLSFSICPEKNENTVTPVTVMFVWISRLVTGPFFFLLIIP